MCAIVGDLSVLVPSRVCTVVRYPFVLVVCRWLWSVFIVIAALYVLFRRVLSDLTPLRSQAWVFIARICPGCAIIVVPVTLGALLVRALEGCGIPLFWRPNGRCALSVRPWTLTRELIIGARVKIS